MRCMTWSGQGSSAVLAGMYTIGVHIRPILQGFPVRYTSYELIYPELHFIYFYMMSVFAHHMLLGAIP